MDHNGAFRQVYINYSPEFGFQFLVRRNARYRKIDFTVPLPDFKNWTTLIGEDILFTGHSTVISFLTSAMKSANDPSLKYISAKHLLSPYPPSLFKDLSHSSPDHLVWLDSYDEGKRGLIDHEVYDKISKIQYLAIKWEGKIANSISSMCVLVVKNGK